MKQRTIEKNFANSAEMYSLNQEWNAFLVLYEFKNFSTAAKKLGITQSALSKCIKKLEAKLQIRLFDRNTRPSPQPQMPIFCTKEFLTKY